ncbi:MAG: tol-pal system-associated acyl-CoA thioesterase [Methylophilaceae bacterium]|nr:MAG: tol-pal system-associated acyl-CoA thioesterase [Methylophilaceae bacterium]
MAAVMSEQHGWQVRVYYEDTDSGGVVYHSNYLNFMERARTEWLRALGFEQTYLKDTLNIIFVVHSMTLGFKRPAKFNDLLVVTSELEKSGYGSLVFSQKITLDGQPLVQAQVKLACVNALTFKPTVIPKSVLLKMESV